MFIITSIIINTTSINLVSYLNLIYWSFYLPILLLFYLFIYLLITSISQSLQERTSYLPRPHVGGIPLGMLFLLL